MANSDEPTDEAIARQLLIREAMIARVVSHPHLICILASHLNETPFYLLMPYLDGVTLETLIRQAGQLATPFALWITRQAAEATGALHRQGWLHGDIKPSNLFVTPEGHVTLLDLGLARPLGSSERRGTRSLSGTLAYLPPEAYSSLIELGPSADVYALGVSLFRMLTGRLPFDAKRPADLADAHLHRVPPDPRLFSPDLPQEVAHLVARMLAKHPERRPSIDGLIAELIYLEIGTFDQRFAA